MLKYLFIYLFLLECFSACYAQDSTAFYYSNRIDSVKLSNYLHVLASDSLEGRETGYKGQQLAANFIASSFASFGIPPLKSGSYFQEYPLEVMHPEGAEIRVEKKKFKFKKDFYYLPGLQDTIIDTDSIVFLGYGIDSKNYSDYNQNLNLKNKILIFLTGEPMDKAGHSLVTQSETLSEWSLNWKKKISYAKSFHPAAILIVVNSLKSNVRQDKIKIDALTVKSNRYSENIPCLYVSEKLVNRLLKPSSRNVKNLKGKIQVEGHSLTFSFLKNSTIKIVRNTNKLLSSNVLGYIEGGSLKEELIILSAHMDHLGKQGDIIYYGADDNASGTSALLEMARVFNDAKKEGHGPLRSVLILAFSGEEKGLLGSRYYVENPVFSLTKTMADLNIDMMGRRDEKYSNQANYIYLIGSDKLSKNLYAINEEQNSKFTHMTLDYSYNLASDPNRFFYRSDQYNFAVHNIPVLFYFNGIHKDYHKSTDTADKIDYTLLRKRTQLVFLTAWSLANRK
jgi:hypothetical protein